MKADRAAGDDLVAVIAVASEDDGGMARSVFLLARHLPEFGVRPYVALHRDGPLAARLRDAGIGYEVVGELIETGWRGPGPGERGVPALLNNFRRVPLAVGRLRRLCARQDAHVLYSHGTWSNYLAALAGASRHAPPVVWHIRNDHSAPATRTAGRLLARWCGVKAVIAVSHAAARPYQGVPNRLEVVYNGVDFATIEAARQRPLLRDRLGLGGEAVLVGFAGRLEPHKGIGVLMQAFRLAAARVPALHLVVLGGSARHAAGDQVAALRAEAAAAGLADRVHLLGYVNEVEAHLVDLDLVAVPSTCRDSCPRTAVEALSLGIPVVGSDLGGLPELVHDRVSGALVPAGSADALADALVALANAPAERRRMGEAAGADARGRFDSRVMTAAVARILHDAAAPPRAPAGARR